MRRTPRRASIAALLIALAGAAAGRPATAAPAKGPYEIKSGAVEMTNSMMEGMTSTLYFDDYGARSATVTSMHSTVMGTRIDTESWQIHADGYITRYDAKKKTGSRHKIPAGMPAMPAGANIPDPRTMTAEMKKSMKELPAREIAGKSCKGMELTAMGMKIKVWSWKGLPLYTETDMSGGKPGQKPIVIQATSLKEGPVPAEKFTAPPDVTITEAKVP